MTVSFGKVALVSPGDRETRNTANLDNHRLSGVARALAGVGLTPELAIYLDELADEILKQLCSVDAALVWVNPIENGRDRMVLDNMLREAAHKGVFVSAHPDTILKMGTKEALYRTREMSWGSDTDIYRSADELRERLHSRLNEGGARVLKQYRGNGGDGVWKVQTHPADSRLVRIRHALRGSVEEEIALADFLARCDAYFAGDGRIIDQPYQERLIDGMVRCYMVRDNVAGFGFQEVNALFPPAPGKPPETAPQPGPRRYYPPTDPRFHAVKNRMNEEWLDSLCECVGLERDALPVIWDADLLYGPRKEDGEDTYVLCEINVSSVYPFPDECLEPMAEDMKRTLAARR